MSLIHSIKKLLVRLCSPQAVRLCSPQVQLSQSYKIFFFLYVSAQTLCTQLHQPFTVMLDPAGDAAHAGRSIDDSFERGITLQFAEHLKKYLEAMHPDMRIVLTRFPGEIVQPLQNANFANRLNVNVYISLHFYQEQHTKPELTIFTYSYNDDTTIIKRNPTTLSFVPYDQAHTINAETTTLYAQCAQQLFSQKYQSLFLVRNVLSLPFKPLLGITVPAFGIEVGLQQKDDWTLYREPFIEMITNLMTTETLL